MALLLTRKVMETIIIGDDIKITIVELRDRQVKIDIDAPRDINIVRGELLDQDDPRRQI